MSELDQKVIDEIRKLVNYSYLRNNKRKIKKRIKYLEKNMGKHDRLLSDYTHIIEIKVGVGIKEKEDIFDRFQWQLKHRRNNKDILMFYRLVGVFYKTDRMSKEGFEKLKTRAEGYIKNKSTRGYVFRELDGDEPINNLGRDNNKNDKEGNKNKKSNRNKKRQKV